jgi:protein-S-isoprenylcysteine O-methyltransferase Ste14
MVLETGGDAGGTEMIAGAIIVASWLAVIVIWLVNAHRFKAAADAPETALSRMSHFVPHGLGFYLIAAPRVPFLGLDTRFVPHATWPLAIGAALVVAGCSVAIWGRVALGDNWSAEVTRRADPETVVTLPYGWVRHPIYLSLNVALVGTALAVGEVRALVGLGLATIGFIQKARIERWARHELA